MALGSPVALDGVFFRGRLRHRTCGLGLQGSMHGVWVCIELTDIHNNVPIQEFDAL